MSTFESYNELDLWKLFLEGDKEAFSVFYRHNYRKLYSYGISLGMDSELIDDIIQELFVKLYTRPQLIKDFSTIQAFLYAAMRNAFVNHEKQRKKYLYLDEFENFELPYFVENTQIEDEEELKALKEKIHRIINSLTPRQKEIIYLRFLHQKEYEEIARIMDMSEQAARNLTYRAMEKIRKENNDFFVLLFMIALFSDYHF
ncbi:RNA polymerase sigma factor [Bacteroides nordii]|uniref:RNA polymerase sigma factor n=1 Tax=Bacteroides nordii TaxID=291645 RepID=UPI0021E64E41|nr:RNA polymerase sigma factor [Bacteroides nordii]